MKYLKQHALRIAGLACLTAFVFSGCDHSRHHHRLEEGAEAINPITSLTKVKMEGICATCGYIANENVPLSNYLRHFPENEASSPHTLVVNVNNLPGRFYDYGRYVSFDFSGSTFTNIGDKTFYKCNWLTGIAIPGSVTSIGRTSDKWEWDDDMIGAFSGCASLESVTIGDGVTIIGDNSFYECTSLTGIDIPESVSAIGNAAFYGSGLTSVTIGNGVTSLISTFSGCTRLTSVTIPNSVNYIGKGAFMRCDGLTSVTFEGTIYWKGFDINAFGFDYYNDGLGSLRDKFYETDPDYGTPGTYTRPDSESEECTLQ
jgi:hypothetical protein